MWTVVTEIKNYNHLTFEQKEEMIKRLKEGRETFIVIDPDGYKITYEPND